ncbi:MAG: PAS domain S-box protein [Vicinamibacterales bacterium]
MIDIRPHFGTALVSAAVFAAGVLLSVALGSGPHEVTGVWLPSGLYLAALLRSPRWRWPAVIVGALAVNIATEITIAGHAPFPAVSFALVRSVEVWVGAVALQAFGGSPSLHRVSDVLRLVAVALLVTALPATLVGSFIAKLQETNGSFSGWASWWIADLTGILIATPFALVPRQEWLALLRRLRGWRAFEAALAFAILGASVIWVAWLPPHPVRAAFVMLPSFLWITFRFGAPALVVALFGASLIGIRGTLAGLGPFARLPPADAALFAQIVVGVAAVCFLIMVAALYERDASLGRLRASEQDARVHDFADTAPAILWAADLSGHRTFLSRGWEMLTGQPSATGLGDGWLGTLHPDDRDTAAAYAGEQMRARRPYEMRYRVKTASGQYRWVMSAGRPQYDTQGKVLGYVGSLIDVHDQTVAAAALARAEGLLDAVFQSAPVGLAFLDRDLRFQKINERLAAINGLPIAAHIGRTPPELLPGIDDMADLMRSLRETASTGQPRLGVEVTGETPASPGARRLWREAFFPVIVAGKAVGVGVVAEDVTEQKRTEQALRESEARFRKLAEEGPVIVWVTAGERVQYVSPRWSEYTGIDSNGPLAADPLLDAVHPEDRDRVRYEWFESPPESAFETEFRLRSQDQQFRWFLSRGVAMAADEQGVQRVGAYVDIHARRTLEQELLESGRRKDEFLAMLAHELRNPLAPIQNAVHLLELAEPGSPTFITAREVIGRQLTHIVRLVDDLLDASRLSRGKLSIRREPTDLTAVVRDTAMDMERSFEERHITLERQLPDGPVWTDGDRTRLAQMIGNLLHNAQKFTPGGGHVRLRLEPDFAHGTATLRVEDTGIGMSDELLTRAFDEFSQGSQTLDRTHGGLGLGLALVRRFAELHGGRVTAFSDGPGRGSTFVVTLPARPNAEPVGPVAPTGTSAAAS